MSGNEMQYINEAFDTNWVVPMGPNVNAFEADLEKFVGEGKSVVALASGTAAVHLALLACGVGPGDEVLVQSFTFCASTHPITYLGAKPVFVDSEPETWNMDPQLLEEAINDRIAKTGRKPKAIVPVYLYGMPGKINEIMEIARRYEIPVVEDAAEGMGSRYHGRVVGTFGDYGVLSFNGNKMITTSGGGALICSSEEAKRKIMWYATQAREAYPYYQHEAIGYNYRLSNICAGIGRGQMTVINDHIAHHRRLAAFYKQAFASVDGITFHDELSGMESNFWLCTITIDPAVRIKGQENASAPSRSTRNCTSRTKISLMRMPFRALWAVPQVWCVAVAQSTPIANQTSTSKPCVSTSTKKASRAVRYGNLCTSNRFMPALPLMPTASPKACSRWAYASPADQW